MGGPHTETRGNYRLHLTKLDFEGRADLPKAEEEQQGPMSCLVQKLRS